MDKLVRSPAPADFVPRFPQDLKGQPETMPPAHGNPSGTAMRFFNVFVVRPRVASYGQPWADIPCPLGTIPLGAGSHGHCLRSAAGRLLGKIPFCVPAYMGGSAQGAQVQPSRRWQGSTVRIRRAGEFWVSRLVFSRRCCLDASRLMRPHPAVPFLVDDGNRLAGVGSNVACGS